MHLQFKYVKSDVEINKKEGEMPSSENNEHSITETRWPSGTADYNEHSLRRRFQCV